MTATTSRKRADDLTASRDGIVTAIEAAQAALLGLADATAGHNALVRRHAVELAEQGLTPAVEGQASSSPHEGVVHVRGEWWHPFDAAEVLRTVYQRVHIACFVPKRYHQAVSTSRPTRDAQAAAVLVARVAPPLPDQPNTTPITEEISS